MKPNKGDLEDCLYETHRQAAMRENASTQILKATYDVTNGNYKQAIVAAMMTIDPHGKHAPIADAYRMLKHVYNLHPEGITREIDFWLMENPDKKLPGFGSSFFKGGQIDPLLQEFHLIMPDQWTIIANRIRASLLNIGKCLQPNLAFYTAATTIELGININLCEAIMIEARLSAWNKILTEIENGKAGGIKTS